MEIVAISLLTVCAFLLFKLLVFHIYLWKEGLTTYEVIQRQRLRKVHHRDASSGKKGRNLISLNRASAELDARSREDLPADESKDDMVNLNQSNMRLVKKQLPSDEQTPRTEKMKDILKTGFLSPTLLRDPRHESKKTSSEADMHLDARLRSGPPAHPDSVSKNSKSLKLLSSPNEDAIATDKDSQPRKPGDTELLQYSASQFRNEESVPSYRANRDIEGELNQSVGPANLKESSRLNFVSDLELLRKDSKDLTVDEK